MKKKDFTFRKTDKVESLVELTERSARLYGDGVAVKYKKRKDLFEKTYNDVKQDSEKIAQYLMRCGLEKGHIALLGSSSYEWICSYIGTMYASLTVVPLDRALEIPTLHEQITDAECDMILYDSGYKAAAESLIEKSDGRLRGFCMDDDFPVYEEKLDYPQIDPDKLSAILFTSGTTGKSKGVMLTQRNIAYDVTSAVSAVNINRDNGDVAMSVLPFNHAFECTCSIFCTLYRGVPVCLSRGLKYMQKEFAEYQPTVMFIVPMIAEKLYDRIWLAAKKQGKEDALKKGLKLSRLANRFGIDISDKLLGDVKAAFGGKLKFLICGGAPLREEFIGKYEELGIILFQGYGLTECSPILTLNSDSYHRPGSVGKIIEPCTVKSVDGEIWAKGTTISTGYYNNPEATAESFVDGWFRTGDMGYVDNDGYVFLTGRKKNLIILGNGENVSAEELEGYISRLEYVTEVVAYGEDGKIVAEIYIDPETNKVPSVQEIDKDIENLNRGLAHYKRIEKFILRDEPFEKTTTQKIKRHYTNKERSAHAEG